MSDGAPVLITSLNPNDVILGRGAGPSQFIGNLRFRSRVEERQKEYVANKGHKHPAKARISRELVDQTHALGGRFLKPVDGGFPGEVWYEVVTEKVALEKCQQTLRDYRRKVLQKEGPSDGHDGGNNGEKGVREEEGNASLERDDVPPALSQPSTFALVQQPTAVLRMATNPVLPLRFNWNDTWKQHACGWLQDDMPWQAVSVSAGPGSGCTLTAAHPSPPEANFSAAVSDNELSAYLMSLLTSDRPMITEEQVELERAAMTDEERVQALTDLFGKQCAVDTHTNKRARKDLDKNAIDFLVQHMRLELERIPKENKRALMEAQLNCHEDEFSDARLERFLRCEGMNAKLGAQRFVNYWESRREVFGPNKFVLRMTLSEALRDDLVALQTCVVRLLPRLDESGRQLIFDDPCRHTRKGYTSDSMLRAIWYVIEVTARANIDIQSGFVFIHYLKDFTMWDYDHGLTNRLSYLVQSCWPVKRMASHLCCAPWVFVKTIKPIIDALQDKHTRCRKLVHDVPESQLLDVLSDYGILKEMLPTEMGGTIVFDQAEWIASQRAAELKEI